MTTILLVDDCADVRQSLRRLLSSLSGITIVGEASNGEEAILVALRERPDVILMDVSMPSLNGFEATERIHMHAPTLRVVMLTAHTSASFVNRALEVGATGYVVKIAAASELPLAIEMVTHGGVFVSALVDGS